MAITQYNSSVRQMSQSKFDSMKNASGKIPDLANQIVMTNSEDTNISCLRTEVVYDMTSSDASKNWGYTSGIQGGVTISGKDFSKYDKLVFYGYRFGIMTFCAEIDITISTKSSNLFGRATNCFHFIEANVSYTAGMTIELNTSLTGFTAKFNQNEYDKNSDAEWFVAKIEGILKTPSMIYTGDELIAGNGISIANGVISRIPLYKDYFVQSYSSAFKVTTQTSVGNFTFNKVLNDSKLVINYSCPLQNNSNGYGSYIGVSIDGTDVGIRCLRNSSGMFCCNEIVSNISNGSHNISFFIGCGAGYTTVPAYENITATIVEVL